MLQKNEKQALFHWRGSYLRFAASYTKPHFRAARTAEGPVPAAGSLSAEYVALQRVTFRSVIGPQLLAYAASKENDLCFLSGKTVDMRPFVTDAGDVPADVWAKFLRQQQLPEHLVATVTTIQGIVQECPTAAKRRTTTSSNPTHHPIIQPGVCVCVCCVIVIVWLFVYAYLYFF